MGTSATRAPIFRRAATIGSACFVVTSRLTTAGMLAISRRARTESMPKTRPSAFSGRSSESRKPRTQMSRFESSGASITAGEYTPFGARSEAPHQSEVREMASKRSAVR